jgi:NAD(P)-dependent dehydrogenase (short-subunit alcohol dehydrogenase family)
MMNTKEEVVLITGASSGFGRLIANELAHAGYIVYASMRATGSKNAKTAEEIKEYALDNSLELFPIELDVQSDASIQKAVNTIAAERGRIDVLVQNAGHMVFGPSEAFGPEQLANLYDVNVLGTQRVNRAVLPYMRKQRKGLIVWISSSSVAGGVPPLLGPYFAAKAGMDALAVCYAKELAPLGIDTSIVVPGAFTRGTNHFEHAGQPGDKAVLEDYLKVWPQGFLDNVQKALANTVPDSADPAAVAKAVRGIVETPASERPLRVYVDPANDGAEESFTVIDKVRERYLERIGYAELSQAKAFHVGNY